MCMVLSMKGQRGWLEFFLVQDLIQRSFASNHFIKEASIYLIPMAVNGYVGYHYQLRVILVGDSSVGKTSLVNELVQKHTGGLEYSTTLGVDYYSKVFNREGKVIKIQVWDTAGQDKYRSIARTYYRNAVGGLIVFDITNRQTFENSARWLEEAIGAQEEEECVYVLVGNKTDKNTERLVTEEEAKTYAESNNMRYIETSAMNGDNVQQAFELLVNEIMLLIDDGRIQLNRQSWDGAREGEVLTGSMLSQTRSGAFYHRSAQGRSMSDLASDMASGEHTSDQIHSSKKCAC